MGFGGTLSQWSKGEYEHANNLEADVGILRFLLGERPDDFTGVTTLERSPAGEVFLEGHIHIQADTDLFTFDITEADTQVDIRVDPWHDGPNLDVGISLWGPFSLQFGAHDTTVNPVDSLSSSFSRTLQPGTYYLTVDGVGKDPVPGHEGTRTMEASGTTGSPARLASQSSRFAEISPATARSTLATLMHSTPWSGSRLHPGTLRQMPI